MAHHGKWWSPITTIETIGGFTNVNPSTIPAKSPLSAGDKVMIVGTDVAGYNTIHTVLTVLGAGSFTIANLSLADANGGTVYKL